MHAARVVPRMAVALGLLAAVGITGCTAGSASAAAPASPSASLAASAPAASGAVKNLVVSPAVRSALLAAYAAFRKIPASDARGLPGSVYYAYQPAAGTYWAKATWEPVSSDSQTVQVGFQDGASDGFYKKTGNGPWQVTLGGEPGICYALKFFPLQVLAAWSLPTSATPASICSF